MKISVRNAEMKDYEAVVKIMEQVQEMHVKWRPDIYKPNKEMIPADKFAEILEDGTFFVAEADGMVAGIMGITLRYIGNPSKVTRNVIFIDSMAVDEEYRGMGIGHLFFEKAKQLKEEKHYDAVELQVNAKNKAAYEMYVKCGFKEKSINMELI